MRCKSFDRLWHIRALKLGKDNSRCPFKQCRRFSSLFLFVKVGHRGLFSEIITGKFNHILPVSNTKTRGLLRMGVIIKLYYVKLKRLKRQWTRPTWHIQTMVSATTSTRRILSEFREILLISFFTVLYSLSISASAEQARLYSARVLRNQYLSTIFPCTYMYHYTEKGFQMLHFL